MLDKRRLVSEVLRFILVSGVAFMIDALGYLALKSIFEIDGSWSKRMSFVCVSFWGFFAHKHFTFRHRTFKPSEPIRFALVYLSGWVINSLVYDATIKLDHSSTPAFLVATFAWACWNFIGQKWFVFVGEHSSYIYRISIRYRSPRFSVRYMLESNPSTMLLSWVFPKKSLV